MSQVILNDSRYEGIWGNCFIPLTSQKESVTVYEEKSQLKDELSSEFSKEILTGYCYCQNGNIPDVSLLEEAIVRPGFHGR